MQFSALHLTNDCMSVFALRFVKISQAIVYVISNAQGSSTCNLGLEVVESTNLYCLSLVDDSPMSMSSLLK